MKAIRSLLIAFVLATLAVGFVAAAPEATQLKPQQVPPPAGPDLDLDHAAVEYLADLDLLVFEVRVAGTAGGMVPEPRGSMDGGSC